MEKTRKKEAMFQLRKTNENANRLRKRERERPQDGRRRTPYTDTEESICTGNRNEALLVKRENIKR